MIRKPGKECLLDEPPKTFRNKECGNEVIEEGEDCDCGLEEDIGEGILSLFMKPNAQPLAMRQQHEEQGESKADVAFRGFSECRRNGCCQDDCKSKPGIDCLFGPCCKNCKGAGFANSCIGFAGEKLRGSKERGKCRGLQVPASPANTVIGD
nr:zinc metalloproteinase-disintegrin-like cobrin [Anolis sagrei ordinatus]